MRVEVLLFGPLADLASRDRVIVETARDAPTARDVRDALATAIPVLRPSLASCRLAVNHAFAHDDATIGAGDEVAVIALVSGG